MKKIYNIAIMSAALVLAAGCSKENPFEGGSKGEGQFLKSSLAVELKIDDTQIAKMPSFRGTRADADINEFNVIFKRQGDAAPVAKYKYADMPDVVTLPEGTYTVTATLGEDRPAEWENPYFLGTSDAFEVSAYEITSYLDPIECGLENIKVTIEYDPILKEHMSEDSYVEVKVGDNDGLQYGLNESVAQKAGYFRHTAEQSIVATFNGKIDGVQTSETKSYVNVSKGNHYRITFKLHDHSGTTSGDANANVVVDASVTVYDVEYNIELAEDAPLDDSERPREDNGNGGNEEPTPEVQGPSIVAKAPIVLDAVNNCEAGDEVEVTITSDAAGGITAFTCDIESAALTKEELQGVGLDSHLDLVNTDPSMADALEGLGFAVNCGGSKSVVIKLSSFIPLMQALGECTHTFVLTVSDANGTTTKNLIIHVK